MEASFWSTLENHPQQTPLGIIALLISRRSLLDSIARSLEVLYDMPFTTTFPPGLPPHLEQILRDLHASTERMLEEVSLANRLLHRLVLSTSCSTGSTLASFRYYVATPTPSLWSGPSTFI